MTLNLYWVSPDRQASTHMGEFENFYEANAELPAAMDELESQQNEDTMPDYRAGDWYITSNASGSSYRYRPALKDWVQE